MNEGAAGFLKKEKGVKTDSKEKLILVFRNQFVPYNEHFQKSLLYTKHRSQDFLI